ncbi:hypothetical protein KOW79_002185 [Hemibagrus wyckioides]|uniref:Uncharacterized protein n=1 Tax=Hemibagrus wyckioides TaxID=337641 RepID=A0A9D3P6G4_9TELE|nr:hypothetical protein KOW79_002185 [Hemibagrus wyckioides]
MAGQLNQYMAWLLSSKLRLLTCFVLVAGLGIQVWKLQNSSVSEQVPEFSDELRILMIGKTDQNPEQVIQLLDQIDKMVTVNGGEYYTTEMLQEAERAIEAEKQRILKENEAQRMKEMEELEKTLEGKALEEAQKRLNEGHIRAARMAAERSPSLFEMLGNFLKRVFTVIF